MTSFIDSSLFSKYEQVSDDVYIVSLNDRPFKLYRNHLIETLQQLHQYSDVPINKLNPEQSELLKSTIEVTRILHNTDVLNLILEDIKRIFNQKHARPGTVAAFFIGCFKDSFPGPLGCNPRCAAALNCESHLDCADTMLVYSNHQFNTINDKQTSHAYIYIEDESFTAFNHQEMVLLQESGIKTMTLIYGNSDGSYREISNRITLDVVHPTSNNAAGIVVLLLLLLFVFLGILYFYRKRLNFN